MDSLSVFIFLNWFIFSSSCLSSTPTHKFHDISTSTIERYVAVTVPLPLILSAAAASASGSTLVEGSSM